MFPARWLGRLGRSRVCQAGIARSRREIEMRSQGSEWLPASVLVLVPVRMPHPPTAKRTDFH